MPLDGLLVVDKPVGPTSHDVVSRVRRILRERRIGHTGTLDPLASGVLLLVVGRATRLAQFLNADAKQYDATIRLGFATDTCDALGRPTTSTYVGAMPTRERIEEALQTFRGTFAQQPPAFSAKKIDGQRSYRLARVASRQLSSTGDGAPPPSRTDADASPETARHSRRRLPDPVTVTTYRIDVVGVEEDRVTLQVECSAGFYVRALAHDLGERLGIGGHLRSLRRTRSGDVTIDQSLTLDAIERDPTCGVRAVIPLSRMLPGLSSVVLTSEGVRHAVHGRDIGPADAQGGMGFGIRELGVAEGVCESRTPNPQSRSFVRLIDPAGDLVAIAAPKGALGLLHPAVVLM